MESCGDVYKRQEWILDIGNDQAIDMALACSQSARVSVRVIATSFDSRPDKLFRPRAHGGRAVHHAGNRGSGNPGALCHFPDVHAQSFMYGSDFTTWGILLGCFLVTLPATAHPCRFCAIDKAMGLAWVLTVRCCNFETLVEIWFSGTGQVQLH